MAALLFRLKCTLYVVRRDCFDHVAAGLAVGYHIVLLCYAQEVNTLHCPPAVRVLDTLVH